MTDNARVTRARQEAGAARERLLLSARQLKARTAPSRLADDAIHRAQIRGQSVWAKAQETARRRPALAAGVALGAAFLLFGKPLVRMIRKPPAGPLPSPKQHALPRPHGDRR